MKLGLLALIFIGAATITQADTCQTRFAELVINGNHGLGPTRMLITQEIVGAETSTTYHYDMGDGNGMGEAIDPPSNPWTLFRDGKMFMSHDKGTTWSFVTAFDGEKARADNKAALTKDTMTAHNLSCTVETLGSFQHDIVEGTYTSSVIAGAEVYEKLWVHPETGMLVQSFRHIKSDGFETKTTQVVELYPNFTLPEPK